MPVFELLDLIGVFAFAIFGAHKAVSAHFDLFGVILCGALTAFGGGTIRELILNSTPIYLHDHRYSLAMLAGAMVAIVIHKNFTRFEKYIVILDAVGIAIFAYIGAYRAEDAHLGFIAIVFFATITAVGGGILSDMVSGRRPEALYKDFYPLAAIVVALGYYIIRPESGGIVSLSLIALGFTVRLISLYYGWKLWRPYRKPNRSLLLRLRKLVPISAPRS